MAYDSGTKRLSMNSLASTSVPHTRRARRAMLISLHIRFPQYLFRQNSAFRSELHTLVTHLSTPSLHADSGTRHTQDLLYQNYPRLISARLAPGLALENLLALEARRHYHSSFNWSPTTSPILNNAIARYLPELIKKLCLKPWYIGCISDLRLTIPSR
jgi:hypothetical protein